jgi:hypothetical protein
VTRRPWLLALVVFLAALLVRLLLWAALGPPHLIAGEDQQEFLRIRDLLLAMGRFLDPDTGLPLARRDPGYPVFLAMLRLLGLGSTDGLWMAQGVLSAATGVFLCVAAWNAAGPRAARVVSVLFLLQASFASYTFIAYSETLACCAAAALLLALARWHRRSTAPAQLSAGGLAAITVLTRCTSLLGILAAIAATARAHPAWRRSCALGAAALLVPLSAWSLRNQVRVGVPFLNTTGVFQLYMGNSPDAPMVHSHRAGNAGWDSLAARPDHERAGVAWRLAGQSLMREPWRLVRRAGGRVFDALEGDRMLIGVARRGQFPERPAAWVTAVGMLVIAVTAIPCTLGLATVIHPGPHWLALAGRWAFLGLLVTQVLTIAHSRYTMPAWILLLPGGALMVERLRAGETSARWAVAAAAVILATVMARQVLVE